jgi:hypothetical protein
MCGGKKPGELDAIELAISHMHLEAAHIIGSCHVSRAAKELGKLRDVADMVAVSSLNLRTAMSSRMRRLLAYRWGLLVLRLECLATTRSSRRN